MRQIILFCALLGCTNMVLGQSKLSISADSILIGDQFELRLETPFNPGLPVEAYYRQLDSMELAIQEPFEIILSAEVDTVKSKENTNLVKTWTLTTFDTLGGLVLDTGKQFPAIFVRSLVLPVDSTNALVDIFEIYEVPYTWDEYLEKYWWILAAILLAALGVYLYLRYKHRQKPVEVEPEVVINPFDWALERIQLLRSKEVNDKVSLKAFFTELSFTLREFLGKETQEPIAEWSLTEIKDWLMQSEISRIDREMIIELLNRGDMVKFAQAQIEQSFLSSDLAATEQLVHNLHSLYNPVVNEAEDE